MIVEGIVQRIETDHSKKVFIEVKLCRVLGVCFDGENLIDEPQTFYLGLNQKNGPNVPHLQQFQNLYLNTFEFNIVGYIRKHDIYDNKIPHLNDELDSNLKVNSVINCLVIRNKLNETKYKDEKLKRDDFIQLSLKNSYIKNAKQYFLQESLQKLQIPLILGINHITHTGKWVNNKNMVKQSNYNNESLLYNFINDYNINEFGTIRQRKLVLNSESGFCYEKMRKIQNYDWSDDCLKKGVDLMKSNFFEKALEYFKDAERLDPLNKDIYIQKGLTYSASNSLEKAMKEFKKCLRIEPDDENAKKYIEMIRIRNEIEQNDKKNYEEPQKDYIMLQKKRKINEK